ncbi:hypothetical membrane-associated protein [Coxiella burnetii CbuK_Q154]|nr:hypothetical membrane-associated protein [Coxiella burnetii CbuK_Q154]
MINFLVFAKTGKGFLIRRAFVSLLAAVLWKISTVNYNARVIDLATLTIIGLLKIFRRGRFGTSRCTKQMPAGLRKPRRSLDGQLAHRARRPSVGLSMPRLVALVPLKFASLT